MHSAVGNSRGIVMLLIGLFLLFFCLSVYKDYDHDMVTEVPAQNYAYLQSLAIQSCSGLSYLKSQLPVKIINFPKVEAELLAKIEETKRISAKNNIEVANSTSLTKVCV